MDSHEAPYGIEPQSSVRSLQIEAEGDVWKGSIKPKIRLMGRWLERAGFKPGNRVKVSCIAPGINELRAPPPAFTEAKEPALEQPEFPF